MDSGAAKTSAEQFMKNESRFRMVEAADPARYKRLAAEAGAEAARRLALYRHLSDWKLSSGPGPLPAGAAEGASPAK
jgi:hypothetical protein